MNVLVVSGIWPPDVGGPASHAPEVVDALRARGHEVAVVTTADAPPVQQPYRVRAVRRNAFRYPNVVAQVASASRRADVVYVASMLHRPALGARLAGAPFVVKLPSDPAFERARWRGWFAGTLDEFQSAQGPLFTALRTSRTAALRLAAHVVTPSVYLRRLVVGWGISDARVSVVANPAPVTASVATGEPSNAFVLAGRLNAQKSVATALEAIARVDGASLVVAGEGPERAELEQRAGELGLNGRVRFVGARSREQVLDLYRGADAAVLSSAWENFPHTAVEALAVGTPVIATAVGGVPEIVEDGRNGLLVPAGDAEALAVAIRRFRGDAKLRERLRAAAAPSVERFAPERIYDELERILAAAAR